MIKMSSSTSETFDIFEALNYELNIRVGEVN